MRYPIGESPDPRFPETELMSDMLSLSVWLSIIIGVMLLTIGVWGRSIWLIAWSTGLILCSIAYLVGQGMGWFYA